MTACTVNLNTGYTYVLSVATGSVFASAFPKYSDTNIAGIREDATGAPAIVTTAEGTTTMLFQTSAGKPKPEPITLPSNTKVNRLTWVELR